MAVAQGHVTIGKLLLDYGFDVNTTCGWASWTPLHIACRNGREGTVRMLLDAGAYVDPVDCYCRTPLHYSYQRGDRGVVELLMDRGARVVDRPKARAR